MGFLVITIILLLAAAAIAVFAPLMHTKRTVALVPALFAVIALVMSSVTMIEAKNVGVQTRLGKPVNSLDAGLHFKAPFDKVTELDGTKITNRYEGESAIPVRIGDGTTADVSTAIRWSIVPDKADEIYADYRSDDVNATLRESLVETVFTAAMNQVLGSYNPTSDLKVVDPNAKSTVEVNFVPDYDALAAEVTKSMESRVADSGNYVQIDFITISNLDLSSETQTKINAFQAEIAKTQVALQEKATAVAKAAANQVLSDSLTPEVIANNCVELLKQMVDNGSAIPVGGIGCMGANSNLILPGNAPQQ